MKNIEFKNNGKKFNECNENEIVEMINISVYSAKEKMLRYYSNVPMIDKLLVEEKNDIISQCYIYAVERAEKYPELNAFGIIYTSAICAYFRLLTERLGKNRRKGNTQKEKSVVIGRYQEIATDDATIINTKNEKQYYNNEYIELKIDMETILTDDELSIIEYRKDGYTQQEIAIIKQTTQKTISKKIAKIKEKMSDYK